MKLYLTNDKSELDGFMTISPLLGFNTRELDNDLVADSEVEEFFAPNIIDFIPVEMLLETIKKYLKKIRKGGKITLGGVDLYLASLLVARREINPIEANLLFFGRMTAHESKSGLSGCNDIAGILTELGIKVTKKTLSGVNYLVEGVRE